MMQVEIERKFLVKNDTWSGATEKTLIISQAYITSDKQTVVRVRKIDDSAWLSIKHKTGKISASEFEYQIPPGDAEALITIAKCGRVDKYRHYVCFNGKIWHVDEFTGYHQGLVVAEIELTSADEIFDLPDWVGEDVTENPAYNNAALALQSVE